MISKLASEKAALFTDRYKMPLILVYSRLIHDQRENKGKDFTIRIPIAVKLALAITLLIVSGMAALGFIILENQKSVLTQQINDMGAAITRQFANSAAEMVLSDDSLGLQTLINNLVDKQQIKGAIIICDTATN